MVIWEGINFSSQQNDHITAKTDFPWSDYRTSGMGILENTQISSYTYIHRFQISFT